MKDKGMDNFEDFTSISSGPSKLASLFGHNKNDKSIAENQSLTYTAPKQPKSEESQKPAIENCSGVKLEIVLHKTVRAFKFVDGAYQDQGKVGLALLGCKTPPLYQLLLYRTRNDVLCKIRLLQNLIFSIQDNNYASFYSDLQQNFSVMFESSSDLREFARQLVLCKSNAQPLITAITQDLAFGDASSSADITNIDVKYTCTQLSADETSKVVQEGQKTIRSSERFPWTEALGAMRVGNEKAVVLPAQLCEPWRNSIDQPSKLIVEVKRLPPAVEDTDKPLKTMESGVESSSEECSIKERGSVLKEALSARSPKSNLISRMARMGQATLPLRGAVAADPSDSEEEVSPSPKPRTRSKPVQVAGHVDTTRESSVRWSQHSAAPLSAPQSVALYQPPTISQFLVQQNEIAGYSSLLSTAAPVLPSPVDGSLSAHFTESRTQATELRMCLGKVTDKIDLVLNKIQELQAPRRVVSCGAVMDPPTIISSIEALALENETLRCKVKDQRQKIEAQNDRLYNLLELSQKNLEQKTILPINDTKIVEDLRTSHEKEKCASEDVIRATNTILDLEKQVQELKTTSESLVKENQILNSKLSLLHSEKLKVDSNFEEASGRIMKAEDSLKRYEIDRSGEVELKSKLQGELVELQTKLKEKEHDASTAQSDCIRLQLCLDQLRGTLESRIHQEEELNVQLVELKETIERQKETNKSADDVKDLMNLLYRSILAEFDISKQYYSSDIKQIVASVIRDITINFLNHKKESTSQEKSKLATSIEHVSEHQNQANKPPVTEKIRQFSAETKIDVVSEENECDFQKELLTTAANENVVPISGLPSPEGTNLRVVGSGISQIDSPTTPKVSTHGEQEFADVTATETQGLLVKEVEFKEEDFQAWCSTQPPPPPLFDEDEDNDSDWT